MPAAWHQVRTMESKMTTLVPSCWNLICCGGPIVSRAGERRKSCAQRLIDGDQLLQLIHGKHLADHLVGTHGLGWILSLQFRHQQADESALRVAGRVRRAASPDRP